MSYWWNTKAWPAIKDFSIARWEFFLHNFFDVVFWCAVSAAVGRLVL